MPGTVVKYPPRAAARRLIERAPPPVSSEPIANPITRSTAAVATFWESGAPVALIGGEGGYAVTPAHTFVRSGYYEEGTLIWRSRWITANGITGCREALAFPAEPGRVVLLRQVGRGRSDGG